MIMHIYTDMMPTIYMYVVRRMEIKGAAPSSEKEGANNGHWQRQPGPGMAGDSRLNLPTIIT